MLDEKRIKEAESNVRQYLQDSLLKKQTTMNLSPYIHNNLLSLKVIPNAKRTELKEENNQLKLYVHALPEKNKANKEVIKFFSKLLKKRVEIKSGLTSKEKLLRLQ